MGTCIGFYALIRWWVTTVVSRGRFFGEEISGPKVQALVEQRPSENARGTGYGIGRGGSF